MKNRNSTQNRYEYLTQTPVPKLISRLAVPTILSMLVTGIYNTADTFFVGRISTQATAAVGLVFSVMAVIQAMGFFCGQGSGTYLSRMLGAGKKQEANEVAATGFALALILGVIVAVLGNVFARPLGYALGAGETTIRDTLIYMRIILLGAPFMMAQFVVNNQLRFQGSAMYAMVGLLCGAAINIGLDPLLMFVFHMGVAGAAIATVSGQFISFVVLLIGSAQGDNIHLKISNVRLNRHYLKEIVNGGSPALARQGLAAIATLLLNQTAGQMGGDAAIAGMSVVTRVLMLLASALIGFGQGYQPVCGFNYGAGLYGRKIRNHHPDRSFCPVPCIRAADHQLLPGRSGSHRSRNGSTACAGNLTAVNGDHRHHKHDAAVDRKRTESIYRVFGKKRNLLHTHDTDPAQTVWPVRRRDLTGMRRRPLLPAGDPLRCIRTQEDVTMNKCLSLVQDILARVTGTCSCVDFSFYVRISD